MNTQLDYTQVSVKGKWINVPALKAGDKQVIITGRWVKVARVQSEAWLESELEDPDACIKQLNSLGHAADVFTFTQKLPNLTPRYDYRMEPESVAAIPLTDFNTWWNSLPQESRKNVRRSQKRGVTVTIRPFDDEMVKGLVELNNESPVRQGRRFTHFGKSFEQVKRDHSAFTDRSEFICAYAGEELIGVLKLVHRGDVASILQLMPKLSESDKRPANALIAKAVERCTERGMCYLTYGNFNYGNKGETSVREFKSRNGFEEVLVPRYYVPLTPLGALWLQLGLHRGLVGLAPRPAMNLFLAIRSRWYNKSKAR